MNNEFIILDQAYKYQVDDILPGGIGYVRLMSLKELSRKPTYSGEILEKVGAKYPYRNQLAAKTIKHRENMHEYAQACEFWQGLNDSGIVPLLKTVEIGNEVLALMPRYAGNLRSLMQSSSHPPERLLKALSVAITGLSKAHKELGTVHLDIKPKNFLCCYQDQKLKFELSDWGIAGVQAGFLPDALPARIETLNEFDMLPYMAPERFDNYLSDVSADIFSLGIMCFEIVTGRLPYEAGKNIAEQITSGKYYCEAQRLLPDEKIANLILNMISPTKEKRLQDYSDILLFLESL